MDEKVYILLNIVGGKAEQVVQILQGNPGVVMADAVEGPPDVVIVMEAPNREQLAKLTNQVLALAETITEHICLLPVRDRYNTHILRKSSRRGNE